jgi:threonine/homoserine/homoserine lactone efflux protein
VPPFALYPLVGFLAGSAVSLWPGSTLSVTIREAAHRGGAAGVEAAAGRSVADLLAVVAIGVTVWRCPGAFAGGGVPAIVFGAVAGASLVGFGLALMQYHAGETLHRERGDEMVRKWHPQRTLDRFLATLLSPLWHLFWWTAGLRLVAQAFDAGGGAGVAAFAAGYLAGGLGWLGFVALRLRASRREQALRDRQYRILTSLGGLVLVLLGFWVGLSALGESAIRPALERITAAVF